MASAVILIRSVEAGHLEESALGDRSGVWLGPGRACHVGWGWGHIPVGLSGGQE